MIIINISIININIFDLVITIFNIFTIFDIIIDIDIIEIVNSTLSQHLLDCKWKYYSGLMESTTPST